MSFIKSTGLCILALSLFACSKQEIHDSNDFVNNGRDTQALSRDSLYLEERLPPALAYPDETFLEGLKQQARFLSRKSASDIYQLEDFQVDNQALNTSVSLIENWLLNPTQNHQIKAYQLRGQDGRGNVQVTGYYVPVIEVRKEAQGEFIYPLYRKPQNFEGQAFPDRDQIDFENVLQGKGLEIAYSSSLIDNFFLQVQGSGVVQYEDGSQALLSWGGVNGHEYRSLGKVLIEKDEIAKEDMSAQAIKDWLIANPERQREILTTNPSYLFFKEGLTKPVGAANVPLTPKYSIAVDPKVIPLGSVLLGELPILDAAGELIHHEYRLLLAQDKGGAIKGAGHIDWYQGIGEEAHHYASQLKHYGRLWLLLPDQR
ncbi:lytic murein transglycosylase A; murein hydrolase A [Marinomonas sp. MED121]|uniref:murein transglycosylase A n=1 Tax=Marinomonas sp. MED121 TaxID=314277 RepID=UPI0000690ED8|nr:murein transglycosylase A [Marinomonas sp. MED121]EAQ64317.1 lytic murein transglycosylase A; murein hydrolase A [Marinomonas sp. MED121]